MKYLWWFLREVALRVVVYSALVAAVVEVARIAR